MDTKTVRITPAMASNWLSHNTINRPMRRYDVDGYIAAFKRGEYKYTHQGIAFADSGELLDGQHRLQAISEMPPGFSVEMLVTRGLDKEAFLVIDKGRKRSHSDALGIQTGHAAVARFLATLQTTNTREPITTEYLIPYARAVEPHYVRLNQVCSKISKTWCSSAVRSAAILRLMDGGDFDYIGISYHALNHDDFDSMAPIVKALYRQQVRGMVSGQLDLFCRAWKAFDHRLQRLDKIQINDTSATYAKAREVIVSKILGQKNAAGSAAAKKVNERNSRLAA